MTSRPAPWTHDARTSVTKQRGDVLTNVVPAKRHRITHLSTEHDLATVGSIQSIFSQKTFPGSARV